MLTYLSKKIAIPNKVQLNCIAWNREQGSIACGGDMGLLKVLLLEPPTGPDAMLQGIAASSNLSMNQTLEGHNGRVVCATWNPTYRKLTTCDESGLIIVWMHHKGMWYEEMINNRDESKVCDMKWSSDGRKIAIIYEDGAVIVGSVDGNRLWTKDLKLPLQSVEWSPDGRLLLFITKDAEVQLYDSEGRKIRQFQLISQDSRSGLGGGDAEITGIHWFSPVHPSHYAAANSLARQIVSMGAGLTVKNRSELLPSTLCIAFANGMIQLSRGEDESSAELLDTDLETVDYVRWSTRGQLLAVVGRTRTNENSGNVVRFYDNYGHYLRTIKIPGDHIEEVSWEGNDLRLALAVDSFIYFANIRHNYLWTSFKQCIVCAHPRHDRREHSLVFWDQTTGESLTKSVGFVKFLVSGGDMCGVVLSELRVVAKASNENTNENGADDIGMELVEVFTVQLRNSIGAVVDSKELPFAPKYVSMSSYHIVLANDRTVLDWQFQSVSSRSGLAEASSSLTSLGSTSYDDETQEVSSPSGASRGGLFGGGRGGKLRIFDIANIEFAQAQSVETFKICTDSLMDPITAIAVSDKFLVVGQRDGKLTRFTLPHLATENTYLMPDQREPSRLLLNSDSSRLAFVDTNSFFTILDLEARVQENELDSSLAESERAEESQRQEEHNVWIGKRFGRKLSIERKDVWDLRWSEDDPLAIAVMEKTKMVVFNDETAEDPVISSCYLAGFSQMEVRAVALDAIFSSTSTDRVLLKSEHIITLATKPLRECRDLIAMEGLSAAVAYANANPTQSRLWDLISSAALEEMDLPIATKAMERKGDYHGLLMLQRIATMPDKMKARAEIAIYQKRFDEAEALYRDIDRKDLAMSMRKLLGEDIRVMQLLKGGGSSTSSNGTDQQLRAGMNAVGDYYADRLRWRKAVDYYQQANNYEALIDCYYRLEQYDELEKLSTELPEKSPLFILLARRFESVGMATAALRCYRQVINTHVAPKEAFDSAVRLHQWSEALALAEEYQLTQAENLLIKVATEYFSRDQLLSVIELYRRADKPSEASLYISELANRVVTSRNDPGLAKKLFVLSALEIERHRRQISSKTAAILSAGTTSSLDVATHTAATLENLLMTHVTDGYSTFAGAAAPNGTISLTLQNTLATLGTMSGGARARGFADAWRGAAAYHYYMVAARQYHSGLFSEAMKTAIKVSEYEDMLGPQRALSLLALAAFRAGFYGVASRAFVKLETAVAALSPGELIKVQALAVAIFSANQPVDPVPLPDAYAKSLDEGRPYDACTVTGRAIGESDAYTCRVCRHKALKHDLERGGISGTGGGKTSKSSSKHGSTGSPLSNCPLCHTPILPSTGVSAPMKK